MKRASNPNSAPSADLRAEAFAYDPQLRMESQAGLERLRCIEDRRLAAALLELYFIAERNSSDEQRNRERLLEERRSAAEERRRLRRLADRALDGELGADARELAEHLLIDGGGGRRDDATSLEKFERALRHLRRSSLAG